MALLFFEGFDDSGTDPDAYYHGTNFDNGKAILTFLEFFAVRTTGKFSDYGLDESRFAVELSETKSTIYVMFDAALIGYLWGRKDIITYPNTGFKVSLFNSTGLAIVNNSNVIVASKMCVLNPADYNWLSIRYTVSSTSGLIEIRDAFGDVILSYSGNTRGTATSDQVIDRIEFAFDFYDLRVDNVYVLDTTGPAPFNGHLPEIRTFRLLPSGPGDITEWSPVNASTVFDAVKEPVGNEDTNYAAANANGQRFLVNAQDLQHNQDHYYAVIVKNRLKRDDAGIWRVAALVRTGGQNYESAQTPITNANTYLNVLHSFVNNPDTGNPWTAAEINAIQFGAKAYLG